MPVSKIYYRVRPCGGLWPSTSLSRNSSRSRQARCTRRHLRGLFGGADLCLSRDTLAVWPRDGAEAPAASSKVTTIVIRAPTDQPVAQVPSDQTPSRLYQPRL